VTCGMISFVSSVTVFGKRDFKIGIRTPDTSGELCGYVTLRDKSLSVSGDYERFYEIGGERYAHILDTKTGEPIASELHSVVVIANDGVTADVLSTAIFVMGIEKAAEFYQNRNIEFEFLCIYGDKIILSDGFASQFEIKSNVYRMLSLSDYILEC
ncbi:MAG: FAD:protein FMN transferase, partial [Clostridia bacterium]|nr:FAD:protein FMN transferase [Clostridia bacterium]